MSATYTGCVILYKRNIIIWWFNYRRNYIQICQIRYARHTHTHTKWILIINTMCIVNRRIIIVVCIVEGRIAMVYLIQNAATSPPCRAQYPIKGHQSSLSVSFLSCVHTTISMYTIFYHVYNIIICIISTFGISAAVEISWKHRAYSFPRLIFTGKHVTRY